MKCKICNKKLNGMLGLSAHIRRTHNMNSKQYYDKYIKDINEGICYCSKETKFNGLGKGYREFCSVKCLNSNKEILDKKRNTIIKNYGGFPLEKKEIRLKAEQTCLKKYGTKSPLSSKKIQLKREETCLERYGNKCSLSNKDIREKAKQTLIDKYGVDHPMKAEKIKDVIKYRKKLKNQISNKNNLPLFDYYAPKIGWIEEIRRFKKDILNVKCKKCGNWFVPTLSDLGNRIQTLNGNRGFAQYNLYCSDDCKQNCPIYHKHFYSEGQNPNIDRPYQKEWRDEVLKLADFKCEICEVTENLQAHHILPVKSHPHLQADIDNGICLCGACHQKHGHQDECSTGKLAKLICES